MAQVEPSVCRGDTFFFGLNHDLETRIPGKLLGLADVAMAGRPTATDVPTPYSSVRTTILNQKFRKSFLKPNRWGCRPAIGVPTYSISANGPSLGTRLERFREFRRSRSGCPKIRATSRRRPRAVTKQSSLLVEGGLGHGRSCGDGFRSDASRLACIPQGG